MSIVRKVTAAASVALMSLSLLLTAAAPAQASAFGCQYIGGFGFTYEGFSFEAPQGWLCHEINGSGKFIDSESASYGAFTTLYSVLTAKVCNWRIDFVYRNTNDTEYRRDSGATDNSCTLSPSRSVTKDKNLRYYGTACAQLYANGILRGKQCHNITS